MSAAFTAELYFLSDQSLYERGFLFSSLTTILVVSVGDGAFFARDSR